MERLTKRLPSGAADYNYPASCYFDDDSGPDRIAQSAFRQKCVERLAEYEDIGRTPEEVTALEKLFDYALEESKTLKEQLALLKRIRNLAEADKDGRLVVLSSNKALTNADRIRSATNQQLAKLLYDNQKEFCRLMYKNLGFEDELNFSEDYSDILAWLNAPSKEAGKALEVARNG